MIQSSSFGSPSAHGVWLKCSRISPTMVCDSLGCLAWLVCGSVGGCPLWGGSGRHWAATTNVLASKVYLRQFLGFLSKGGRKHLRDAEASVMCGHFLFSPLSKLICGWTLVHTLNINFHGCRLVNYVRWLTYLKVPQDGLNS